jgi:hypothetical protein
LLVEYKAGIRIDYSNLRAQEEVLAPVEELKAAVAEGLAARLRPPGEVEDPDRGSLDRDGGHVEPLARHAEQRRLHFERGEPLVVEADERFQAPSQAVVRSRHRVRLVGLGGGGGPEGRNHMLPAELIGGADDQRLGLKRCRASDGGKGEHADENTD